MAPMIVSSSSRTGMLARRKPGVISSIVIPRYDGSPPILLLAAIIASAVLILNSGSSGAGIVTAELLGQQLWREAHAPSSLQSPRRRTGSGTAGHRVLQTHDPAVFDPGFFLAFHAQIGLTRLAVRHSPPDVDRVASHFRAGERFELAVVVLAVERIHRLDKVLDDGIAALPRTAERRTGDHVVYGVFVEAFAHELPVVIEEGDLERCCIRSEDLDVVAYLDVVHLAISLPDAPWPGASGSLHRWTIGASRKVAARASGRVSPLAAAKTSPANGSGTNIDFSVWYWKVGA